MVGMKKPFRACLSVVQVGGDDTAFQVTGEVPIPIAVVDNGIMVCCVYKWLIGY